MLLNNAEYQSSFDKAMACMVECEHCAQSCLTVSGMEACVKKCLDCAETCRTLASFMVRGSFFIAPLARACAEICEGCAKECESHDSSHCKKCAKSCHEAAEAYRQIENIRIDAKREASCC